MSEIPKAYEPQSVEDKWYDFWLKQGCFTADPARVSDKRPAYSIVIPPPNVTGMLHMGHVLNNTIQDIVSRKARMDGKEVLWLPGTDHAGIATEGMVSKQIWKDEKKSKREIGREEFIKRVWAWKEKHGGIIISQLKKLGCSCDWTRERFTMDEHYVRCVQKVFVELFKRDLILRGKRMVNWCPATQTALSDEEVVMKEQKGFLYYFKVEVVEQPGTFLTIATTRPETIPGDTAVAVNPKDTRYAKLIGKHIRRPLPVENQASLPIIGDEHVDFEFGTGVLKVTPAHDKADYAIYQRLLARLPSEQALDASVIGLPIEVIGADGIMTSSAGNDLKGLERFKARKVAVEKLNELLALEKEEAYTNSVGFSERADVPIEPRLSDQWFLQYPSVAKSRAVVAEGGMQFFPERWAKVYDHWLTNIQEWCISRQLWWGHRIPVWTRRLNIDDAPQAIRDMIHQHKFEQCLSSVAHHRTIFRRHGFVNDLTVEAATESEQEAEILESWGFTQDPDVLDTWFSSWLWPFATMGWPEQTDTLKKFYPTTDLVTGPDIIFFWVARMIMAGYEFMGEPKFGLPDAMPFRNVYFTGIIRDKQGRKMSKTLGNSPDPLVLIAQYGADALRFGTMRSAPLGQDVLFDEKDVELGRNFCNKLWNACRFRQIQSGGGSATSQIQGEINPSLLTNDDKWILLKLHQAIKEITEALNTYNFNTAVQTLYRFFWSEYCDWYVEATKAVLSRPATDVPPSPLKGERAGVRGENESDASHEAKTPPHPDPLPPAARGGEGTAIGQSTNVEASSGSTPQPFNTSTSDARRANTLAVIDFVLSQTLRLFHPFLPFITEELWHGMGYAEDMPENQGGKTIMNAPWPKPFDGDFRDHYALDDCYLEFTQAKYDLVTEGRNLRRIGNIPGGKKVKFIFKSVNPVRPHDAEVIKILLNAEALEIVEDYQSKKGTPTAHTPMGELFLPLEGLVDVEAEKARLKKELEKVVAEIAKVEQKLSNPSFTSKAPPQVLQEHQQRLAEWLAKKQKLDEALKDLEG